MLDKEFDVLTNKKLIETIEQLSSQIDLSDGSCVDLLDNFITEVCDDDYLSDLSVTLLNLLTALTVVATTNASKISRLEIAVSELLRQQDLQLLDIPATEAVTVVVAADLQASADRCAGDLLDT